MQNSKVFIALVVILLVLIGGTSVFIYRVKTHSFRTDFGFMSLELPTGYVVKDQTSQAPGMYQGVIAKGSMEIKFVGCRCGFPYQELGSVDIYSLDRTKEVISGKDATIWDSKDETGPLVVSFTDLNVSKKKFRFIPEAQAFSVATFYQVDFSVLNASREQRAEVRSILRTIQFPAKSPF